MKDTHPFGARLPRFLSIGATTLAFAFALSCSALGADAEQLRKLKNESGKELETGARLLLADPEVTSLPLAALAELYAAIESGGSPADLRELMRQKLRDALAAPDLEKQRTLPDALALWTVVRNGVFPREMRPWVSKCIRRVAEATEYEDLRKAFLASSPTGGLRTLDRSREALFWLLSDRWMEREVAALMRDPKPEHRCPPFAGEVPPELKTELTAEGVTAWTEAARFQQWVGSGSKAFTPVPGHAEKQKPKRTDLGEPNFEGMLDRFFANPHHVSFEELSRYYWTSGFWCGTGGEGFQAVQSRLALMIQLRDQRVPDVLAGTLREQLPLDTLPPSWSGAGSWRRNLIEHAGLDWEKLLSSSLLLDLPIRDPGRSHYAYASSTLAAHGSTFAAKIVLAVERRARATRERAAQATEKGASRPLRADIVARFITPGDVPPGTQPEVEPEIQKELVGLLVDNLRTIKDPIFLANSLEPLAYLRRTEIKEAIRPLLESRFDYVAQCAARALSLMGEKSPVARPRSNPTFRILLNEKEWPFDWKISAVIHYKSQQDGWGINNFLTVQSRDPRKLEFNRDQVLQRSSFMTEARLVIRPRESPDPKHTSLAQPWFAAPVTLPIQFDQINEVRASVCPLPINVSYPASRTADAATVTLELTWLDEPGTQRPSSTLFREPLRKAYTFAALQPGKYRLAVVAPGAARFEQHPILVKKDMAPVHIKLTAAADVRAKIVLPNFAEDAELPHVMIRALRPELWLGSAPMAGLYCDGVEVASATFESKTSSVTFSNVPPGSYRLRIHGINDVKRTHPKALTTDAGEMANTAWEDAEIEVTVKADAPVVIDAGEIRLQPVTIPPPPR